MPTVYQKRGDEAVQVAPSTEEFTQLESRVEQLETTGPYVLPVASTTQLGGVKVDGTTITASEDGVISASVGDHVAPATDAPQAPGIAAVGVSDKYAREDHVHPAQDVPTLSDAVDSTSSSVAASSNAVKTAYDAAVSAGATAAAAQEMADSAYSEAIKVASTTQAGRVQLSDAVDSDSSDTAATSKAVKTLNDRIVASATGGVTLRGTRTTKGIWTVTGLIVGKPLYILHSSLPDNAGDAYVNFSALSGTNDAMISGSIIRYQVGRGHYGFPNVCIVIPTATEVSFEIINMVGVEGVNFLRAYQ